MRYEHPIARGASALMLRVGGTYAHIELEDGDGDPVAGSGHGFGWEAGAGLTFPLGELSHAETVTLFNDLCIMAPAMLIDPAITWAEADAQTVHASLTNAGHTIRAELVFNEAGELTNFWSDDRRRAAADGRTLDAVRWSMPVGSYRTLGPVRLASRGEGRWHETGGEYAYLELALDEVEYNVPAR